MGLELRILTINHTINRKKMLMIILQHKQWRRRLYCVVLKIG